MKRYFGFFFLLLLITSCDSETVEDQVADEEAEIAADNFTISGVISGANKQMPSLVF